LSWLDAPEPKPDSEAVLVSSPKSPPVSAADRKLTFRGLRHPIRMNECLVLGNPQAEVVIVEMMDYTCKHCRHLHAFIHAALERYGDKLAVVVAPTPLGSKCNPYVEKTSPDHKYSCDFARLATGLGFRSPELFADYHNWLMKTEEPQIIFDARIRAMDLSGAEVLTDQQLRARVNRYLSVNAEAQHEIGGGLPVMFTSEGVIRGIPKSQQEWFKFLEEKLGLAPVPATLGETASAGQGG
jgi:hypothetical protein